MDNSSQLVLSLAHDSLHAHTVNGKSHPIPLLNPTAIEWDPSGLYFAHGDSSGQVTLRNQNNFTSHTQLPSLTSAPVSAITFSSNSRYIAIAHVDGLVGIYETNSYTLTSNFVEQYPIHSLSFQYTNDSRHIAIASSNSISVYSRLSNRLVSKFLLPTHRKQATLSVPRQANNIVSPSSSTPKITAAAFSPVHQTLLAAADDAGCLTVWNISQQLLARPRTQPRLNDDVTTHSRFPSALRAPATSLCFSGEGILCVAGFDKNLRIFDATLKRFLFTVLCPCPISSVSFSSDNNAIVAGLTDASLAVINVNITSGEGSVSHRIPIDSNDEDIKQGSSIVKAVAYQPQMRGLIRRGSWKQKQEVEKRLPRGQVIPRQLPRRKPRETDDTQSRSSTASPADDLQGFLDSIDSLVDNRIPRTPSYGQQAVGFQDSDLFSPVAKRKPLKKNLMTGIGLGTPGKARSFHGTLTQGEITGGERNNYARRSQSIQELTPLRISDKPRGNRRGEVMSFSQCASPEPYHYNESQRPRSATFPSQAPTLDSRSLEAIVAKLQESSVTSSSKKLTNNVSTLQGSTVSYDSAELIRLAEDSIRNGNSVEQIREKLSPSYTEKGERISHSRRSEKGRKELFESNGVNAGLIDNDSMMYNGNEIGNYKHRSVDAQSSGLPDLSRVKFSPTSSDLTSTRRLEYSYSNPPTTERNNPISEDAPEKFPSDTVKQGELGLNVPEYIEDISGRAQIAFREELDLVRTDLRNDILNIHAELVMMASHQSNELKALILERDQTINRLRAEVKKLRSDNQRLRQKYGLG